MNRGKMTLILLAVLILLGLMIVPVNANEFELPPGYDLEGDMLGRINRLRRRYGLPPYQLNAALTAAAQNQADWLVETGRRTHIRPDGSKPSDRIAATGYVWTGWCCGENYYMSIDATPDLVWDFWRWSPMHFINLVHREFDTVGVGYATDGRRISYVLTFGNMLDDSDVVPPLDAQTTPEAQPVAEQATPERHPVVEQQTAPVATNTSAANTHIVTRGETLFRIAVNYNTTTAALARVNNIANPSQIYVGQRLIIPTGGEVATLSQTTAAAPQTVANTSASCAGFRATSPTDGFPNGPVTFYWEPLAQQANGYRVNVYDEAGDIVGQFVTGSGSASLDADVGVGAIGGGFMFSWEVVALNNGVPLCTSNRVGLFRESS